MHCGRFGRSYWIFGIFYYLQDHPCQHPVVIIKGIKSHQLQLVLQFIYFGQVSVEKREIQNFIEAAELLKIDGISANEPPQHEYGGSRGSRSNSSTLRQPLMVRFPFPKVTLKTCHLLTRMHFIRQRTPSLSRVSPLLCTNT